MSHMRLRSGDRHHFGEHFTPRIEDIAFALSNINRYGGHVGRYSVAQHSILVAQQLPEDLRLSGLLHDAPEAYIGDVCAPLKVMLPEYRSLEQHYHSTIDSHFNVWTQHEKVKEADLRMLITEAQYFGLWERGTGWSNAEPFDIPDFHPMPAKFAETAFLYMFKQLTKGMRNVL